MKTTLCFHQADNREARILKGFGFRQVDNLTGEINFSITIPISQKVSLLNELEIALGYALNIGLIRDICLHEFLLISEYRG